MNHSRFFLFFALCLSFLSRMDAHEKKESSSSVIRNSRHFAIMSYLPKMERFIYLNVNRVSDTVIELQDGSQWEASVQDTDRLMSWQPHDWVTITPKWVKNEYAFNMNNYRDQSTIEVNLIGGPILGNSKTNTISRINLTSGKIDLSNGSSWQVAESDFPAIEEWALGQTVIFGSNDSLFASYRGMLINASLNQYVFAKEI